MKEIIKIAERKVLEEINQQLSEKKRRGFVPMVGLTPEELRRVAALIRGLGLKAGVGAKGDGVWWAVPTNPPKK